MKNSTKRKRSQFVTNEDKSVTPTLTPGVFTILTFNLKSSLVRNATMEGRKYKVVPMVMITEGVHNGSKGKLFYSKDELAAAEKVWNHKPLVVNHPDAGASACDPAVIDKHKIGVVMNTKLDSLGRLKADAYIEEERANLIEPRVMLNINAGKQMEVSTGLYTDNEMTSGTWNGEAYDAIARNHKPDHLAILPDDVGACSIKDGAGLLRNAAADKLPKADVHFLEAAVCQTLRNMGVKDLTANDLSFDSIRSQLYTLLRQYVKPNSKDYVDVWIEDVFEGYFIYSWMGKLSKLGYVISGEVKVELEGEPEEVIRVTEYKTSKGAVLSNQSTSTTKTKSTMNKKEVIDGLIANTASGWKETDREFLTACSDERLQTIATNAAAKPAVVANKDEPAKVKDEAKPAAVAVVPVLNADDQEALNYGKQQLAQNKSRLIATIKANPANKFTDAVLNAKNIEELGFLAELAANAAPSQDAPRAPYFGGQGQPAPTQNKDNSEQKPLGTPVMNFEAPAKVA